MKTIFITGASSGLGLSHAIYLSSLGYTVIGTSRHAEDIDRRDLKETFLRDHTKYGFADPARRTVRPGRIISPASLVRDIAEHLERIRFVSMDVTDQQSVKRAVEEIEATTPIDVLVNNAGYAYWGTVEETSEEEAQRLFDVDFFGHIRVLRAVIPCMRARRSGQIINTTSMAALVGIPFCGYYAAAKAGMERITESLYTELKPLHIRVSSLLPGDVNTSVDANMVVHHAEGRVFKSTDVGGMIDALPTPSESPYYARSQTVWGIFIRNHIVAPPPLVVSRTIARIIESKNPRIHYSSGTVLQTRVLPAMKSVLPNNVFLDVVAKVFGL